LHGGAVEARSEGLNRGSEFTLRIPLAGTVNAIAASAEAKPKSDAQQVMPRRVMVVDDNVDAAAMLDMLLRSLGHETRVAHEGTAALRVAEEFRPDIVLLDIGMPGIDGYEVARRLRTLAKARPMRIVAVTGWGQEGDRERSREAGFDLHLVKPVDANELSRALNDRSGATLH
jgi:CheY-like chemotaxis protein